MDKLLNAIQLFLFLEKGHKPSKLLTTVVNEMFVCSVGWAWLGPVKQVRVITALPELHEDVEQPHLV